MSNITELINFPGWREIPFDFVVLWDMFSDILEHSPHRIVVLLRRALQVRYGIQPPCNLDSSFQWNSIFFSASPQVCLCPNEKEVGASCFGLFSKLLQSVKHFIFTLIHRETDHDGVSSRKRALSDVGVQPCVPDAAKPKLLHNSDYFSTLVGRFAHHYLQSLPCMCQIQWGCVQRCSCRRLMSKIGSCLTFRWPAAPPTLPLGLDDPSPYLKKKVWQVHWTNSTFRPSSLLILLSTLPCSWVLSCSILSLLETVTLFST